MDDYEIKDETQNIKKPIIISFDLEVSPALGYFYPPTWETGILKVEERQKLMCFAWQHIDKKKIHSLCLADMPGYDKNTHDDRQLVEELHKTMTEADILLGQNSDSFDIKMANYFFIRNGLEPIPPTKSIDTKKIAKRYFRFANNTLGNLAEELGVGSKSKVKHSDIWEDCFLLGDRKMWKLMNTYCENDVRLTTEIYLKMRSFMHTHPSLSRISGEWDSCPRCGSYSFRIKAYRTTNTLRYHQYQCNDCQGYFSDRKSITEESGDNRPAYVNI
jgi:DNA polymerase elongation subunit (family B)